MTHGKFIVIEGGDGAGKDTQIALLKKEFGGSAEASAKAGEEKILFVKDPGGTDIGTNLREIVLHNERVTRSAEFLIYLASRAQLVEEKIKPALKSGKDVISNRFDISTIAYQIYGRERTDMLDLTKRMSDFACGGLRPDLIVFLDCPPELGLRRALLSGEKIDRFEKEKIAFHTRVREGYTKHLPDYNHVVIDGTRPIQEVFTDVLEAVREVLH